jgi:SAM-dependent methyltransferase
MRELSGISLYDAVLCYFTSFGYFEDEADDLLVVKRIASVLRPGGRFLIDTQVTESMFPRFQERRWVWLDRTKAKRLLEEARWDFETGRVDAEWTFLEGGTARVSSSSIRMYSYRELCGLLREAGFRKFEGFETLTGNPFSLGAQRLSLVAML